MKSIEKEIEIDGVKYIFVIESDALTIKTGISALSASIEWCDLNFGRDMQLLFSRDFMISLDLMDKYDEVKEFVTENELKIAERNLRNDEVFSFYSDVNSDLEAEYHQYLDDNRE